MSLLCRHWQVPECSKLSVWQQILASRDLTESSLDQFFSPEIHDPLLLRGMEQSIKRLKQAQQTKERVMVFGDYDADGVSAAAVLVHFFSKAGIEASYRLPHREKDGYGLKKYFIDECKEKNVTLIVTVDTGAVAFEEVLYAQELGIDVIVTDHHAFQEKDPDAYATINPKNPECQYPFSEISGSILAWKLSLAAAPSLGVLLEDVWELLPFAIIGLIGDCCPLIDENRSLVQEGLRRMKKTSYSGLHALISQSGLEGKQLESEHISFQLAPRVNAAGRLSTPYHALQLFLGKQENALLLEELNATRKTMVEEYMREALCIAEGRSPKKLLFLKSDSWHPGIIGLIAGRLTEKYGHPSIVLTKKGDSYVASCRAPDHFDIFNHLQQLHSFFSRFGGHKQAAGFTIKEEVLDDFEQAAYEVFEPAIDRANLQLSFSIDAELSAPEATLEFCTQIETLAPFGIGNRRPVFLLRGSLGNLQVIGSDKTHLRGSIDSLPFIAFRWAEYMGALQEMEIVEAVGTLSINEFQGRKTVQFQILDMREKEKDL